MAATTEEKNNQRNYVELTRELKTLQDRVVELKRKLRNDALEEEISGEEINLLLFKVEDLDCAFILDSALEIAPFAKLEPLAETLPWVPGTLNVRGEIVPIIDLSARVFGRARVSGISDFIIICRGRTGKVGFVVQSVDKVVTVTADEIKRATIELDHAHYVLGVIQTPERQTQILGIRRIIDSSDLLEDKA